MIVCDGVSEVWEPQLPHGASLCSRTGLQGKGTASPSCQHPAEDFPQHRAVPCSTQDGSTVPPRLFCSAVPWRHWGQLGRVQTRNPRGFTAPDPDPHNLAVLAPTINPSAPELLLLSIFALEKNPKKASFLGEVFVPRTESDHRSQWERPDGHPSVWESSACSCPIEPWRSQAPIPAPVLIPAVGFVPQDRTLGCGLRVQEPLPQHCSQQHSLLCTSWEFWGRF